MKYTMQTKNRALVNGEMFSRTEITEAAALHFIEPAELERLEKFASYSPGTMALSVERDGLCIGVTAEAHEMEHENKCATCAHNTNPGGLACEYSCGGVTETDGNGLVIKCDDYRMGSEKVNEHIGREVFVRNLEGLLRRADLDVAALRYIYPDYDADRTEAVEISFKGGGKRRVCIEADSRAAIIKDVLRGCE